MTLPLLDPTGKSTEGIARDVELNNRILREMFSPVPYVPTWTGSGGNPSLGNGTSRGEYMTMGHLIVGWFLITAGNTTTFGSGNYEFGIPKPRRDPPGGLAPLGKGRVVDSGTGEFIGFLGGASVATAVRIILSSATTTGAEVTVTNLVPMTPAASDSWGGYFTYFKVIGS